MPAITARWNRLSPIGWHWAGERVRDNTFTLAEAADGAWVTSLSVSERRDSALPRFPPYGRREEQAILSLLVATSVCELATQRSGDCRLDRSRTPRRVQPRRGGWGLPTNRSVDRQCNSSPQSSPPARAAATGGVADSTDKTERQH